MSGKLRTSLFLMTVAALGPVSPAVAQRPQPHQQLTLRKFDPPYRLPEGVTVDADVVFSSPNGRDLHMDLFAPERGAGPFPGVLFIQGSGHNGNNKVQFWREAAYLAGEGFVALTIEHRGLGPDRARWPAQLEDCEAALRWMTANAARYRIDPARIGVVGASSGAHLAALLGLAGPRGRTERPPIRAVVLISGLLDLIYFAENRVWSDEYRMWIDFAPLLGASYDQDPQRWREASPIAHVSADDPPVLIMHGTADGTLPLQQAERFYHAARAAGVAAEFVPVQGGTHEMTNALAYSATRDRMKIFLARLLQ